MIEVLNKSYFLFDRLHLLLADRHLLHSDDTASQKIDPLVDETVRTLADCLDYLVWLDYASFRRWGTWVHRAIKVWILEKDNNIITVFLEIIEKGRVWRGLMFYDVEWYKCKILRKIYNSSISILHEGIPIVFNPSLPHLTRPRTSPVPWNPSRPSLSRTGQLLPQRPRVTGTNIQLAIRQWRTNCKHTRKNTSLA